MSSKLNCWEYLNCGLEPGGIFSKIHGPCPIPQMMRHDGANGGRGAGRVCWEVMPKLSREQHLICRNRWQSCVNCRFYARVLREIECPAVESEDIKTP